MSMQCDDEYGCGKTVTALFSVRTTDWSSPDSDDDGIVVVKVCRDCVASGDWED